MDGYADSGDSGHSYGSYPSSDGSGSHLLPDGGYHQHTEAGWPDGDPADAWVLDPVTGEYRMLRPGEHPPALETRSPAASASPAVISDAATPSRRADTPSAPPSSPASAPPSSPASAPAGRGTDRRSRRAGPRRAGAPRPGGSPRGGGAWLVGTFSVVGLVGCAVIGYAVLHHPATPAETCTAAPATPSTPPPVTVPGKTAKPLPPGPSALPINTRVTVLNGSGVDGAGQFVLTWMQNTQGYLRTSNGGSARTTAMTSLVYAPDHIDQARTLAAAMHLPPYALHGTGKATGPRDPMILTLGKDFRAAGKPLAPPPTPTPTPTPTTVGPGDCAD